MDQNFSSLPNVRSRNSIFSGQKDSCWLYRWLHIHSFILFIKCLFRPLRKEDNFNLSQQYWPQNTDMEFNKWRYVFPYTTINQLVLKMIKTDITLACFLSFLDSGLGFAGTIIIKYILSYLNTENPTDVQRSEAFALSGLWIAFYAIKIFVREYWIRLAEMAALKVEILLEGQLYRKIMRLSGTYRKYINPGGFFAYWIVDVGVITSCITSFPTIVGAPTTLILSVIFVCIQIGAIGLLLLVAIIISIVIQLLINLQMASIYKHKLFFYQNRMIENAHLCKKFNELKYFVWEKLLLFENIRIRVPENNMNRVYYLLSQIYVFVCSFAPYLIVLIILLTTYSINSQSWQTAKIYTIITYISVIYTPLLDLPSIIGKILQSIDVFHRINNFFTADERVKLNDYYLQNGTIEINHPIFCYASISSINRIITKESLFISKKKYMQVGLREMPLEVRLYSSLEFMSDQETKKFCGYLKCLSIPFNLKFKKGDKIVVLSNRSGAGKTSFIRSLLGGQDLQSGQMRYGGKIGYVGPNSFLLDDTIQYNVLFGEEYDEQRLRNAYKLSGLQKQLLKFKDYDRTKVDGSCFIISRTQKTLICLARAIYYECDILVLDDFFNQFQIDQSHQIQHRIRMAFENKVLIFTTYVLHSIYLSDHVLILRDRIVIEQGTFEDLLSQPHSTIHSYKETDINVIHYQNLAQEGMAETDETDYDDSYIVSEIQHRSPHKIRLVEEYESLYTKAAPPPHLKPTPQPYVRPGVVQFKYYTMLFRNGGIYYILTFCLIAVAVGLQAFGTWLVGNLAKQPFSLSYGAAVILYSCVQIGNGVALLIFGIFLPKVITFVIERISNTLNTILCRRSLQGACFFSSIQILFHYGNDLQIFYSIIDCLTAVFSNFAALVSIVIIMGIVSYDIWIVAGVTLVYTTCCYAQFRRAYQEDFIAGADTKLFYFKCLHDYIEGIETIQFYDKVEWFRARMFDGIYFFSGVYKANLLYISHSFNILNGFSVLGLTAGILFLAISGKSLNQSHIVYLNIAVSAVPKLLSNVTNLFSNLGNMVRQMTLVQKVPFEIQRGRIQEDFDKPPKSLNCFSYGSIEFRNVIYERKELNQPIINSLNLRINEGEIIGMCVDAGNDEDILFHLLNGMIRPTTLDNRPAGDIYISGINTRDLNQRQISQQVLLMNSFPAAYTGTIKFNVDPFNRYSDQQIQSALNSINFWAEFQDQGKKDQIFLSPSFKTLYHEIEQRGEYLSNVTLQKLNIVRAILKKPKVLLLNRSFNKLDLQTSFAFFDIIRREMKKSAVLFLAERPNFILRADRVICFKNGSVIEEGKPWELVGNKNTKLNKIIRLSKPRQSATSSEIHRKSKLITNKSKGSQSSNSQIY